jgi:putative transport protein
VGISSGSWFFAALRRKGLRDNLLVLGMLFVATGLTYGVARLFELRPTLAVGMFTGSLTNTPALASSLEYIKANVPAEVREQWLAEPVIGYSVTYPMGIIGMLIAIATMQRFWHIDYAQEAQQLRSLGATYTPLQNYTIQVTRSDIAGKTIQQLIHEQQWNIVVGRLKRGDELTLATGETCFAPGDIVSIIGVAEDVERVAAYLGIKSTEHLDFDLRQIEYQYIFVSNPEIAGRRVQELHLQKQFGALITRVRRGDVELIPQGNTVLELGDRVRVVARHPQMEALTAFFGDSYRALSEVNILTLNLGLALGVLLGLVPIPLPGGINISLGFAGGPLLMALVLGALQRTGPLVWGLPYSANLTLRQIGLVLFLAGVGTRAGYAFVTTFTQGGGLVLFLIGALLSCAMAFGMLWIGHRLLKVPMSLLIGMLAGFQTQPAVLGFALQQTRNELPNVGYATVYPIATIAKIVCAQLLLFWL